MSPAVCQKSAQAVNCGDSRVAVGHHDQPCPSACLPATADGRAVLDVLDNDGVLCFVDPV